MRRIRNLFLTVSLLSLLGCAPPSTAEPKDALRLLKDGAILVDVRTAAEQQSGHLENAILLPHEEILSLPEFAEVKKDTPLVVYCQSGRRSELAKETLEKAGYTKVFNGGGYEELKQALEKAD